MSSNSEEDKMIDQMLADSEHKLKEAGHFNQRSPTGSPVSITGSIGSITGSPTVRERRPTYASTRGGKRRTRKQKRSGKKSKTSKKRSGKKSKTSKKRGSRKRA